MMSRRIATEALCHPAPPRSPRATMADSVRCLARLLRQENEALAAMDFARAGALLAAKHHAASSLAAAWRAAASLEASAEDLRQLGKLAAENKRLANGALRVQRRVLDLVAKAARDAEK